ncbi:MAG: choice-of-anchor A family protein, partial [Rhodospirillales bacterium]|nr:choice-of-anchor A family protein [Acetobacter sp.]
GSTISGARTINTSQASFAGTAQNTQPGNIHTGVASGTVFPYGSSISANFQAPLTTLASALANLPSVSGVSAEALTNPAGGNLTFTAHADYVHNGLSYGVITTSYDNLASEQNFGGINNNGNAATFVIVTGDDPNVALPTMNASSTASNVIWDFVDATVLRFQGIWYGQILGPKATITQQNGDLDGSVVVQSLQQTNELHFDARFTGNLSGLAGIPTGATTVPEPSTLVIAASGLLFLHTARRSGRTQVRQASRSASQ